LLSLINSFKTLDTTGNFCIEEYEALVKDGITIPPAFNLFEVYPFLYRPKDVECFQRRGNMLAAASKAMH